MIDIKDLIKSRYAQDSDLKKSFDMPDSISKRILRKSCRKFKKSKISKEILISLIASAQAAPSKSNLQQYSILLIKNKEMKNQLSKLLGKTAWALEAPLFFLFLADIRRNKIITEHKGYEYKNNSIDYFMNAVIDASLAMQNLINSAEEFGLGICPISMVRNHLVEVKKMCHLPEGVFPIAGLSVGWPDENNDVSIRLPMKVVFHEDFYNDKDMLKQIDHYDKTIECVQPIPKSKQRHVNVYGFNKKNTWSENISRQMSLPERKEFKKWLKSHGFNLD